MTKQDRGNGLPIHSSCPANIQIPTEREVKALNALRDIKNRVREVKGILDAVSQEGGPDSEEKTAQLNRELAELKIEWNMWEEERKAAAKERMVLLGHDTND